MNKTKRQQCLNCLRPTQVCFCHTLQSIDNHWPIHILQHPNESKHAIGTAKIAQLSLKHCETDRLNNVSPNLQLSQLLIEKAPLLIYPSKESTPLKDIDTETIRPLIFLDGSWRKTRRMMYEIPALNALPKVSFTPNQPSRYRIRKEPNPSAISTLEAIVTVLSELEKTTVKYQPLLDTMDWMINKQIELMGDAVYHKNYEK